VGKSSIIGSFIMCTLHQTLLGQLLLFFVITVDSRLSARGLTALRLNRGSVFLKKKFYFP
jgi:hypothetical protein